MKYFCVALLLALGLALTACPTAVTRDKVVEPADMQVLEPTEAALFDFPADGLWHPSPFQALNGQQLIIRPVGAASGFAPAAIQFKIGRLSQIAHPTRPFCVTQPGRIELRVAPEFLQEDKGLIAVQVERIE